MTAPPFGGSFVMVDPAHVAEVGPAAAVLFSRICWRAERDGAWRASRAVLSQETGLSLASLRTALQVLRDAEWVTAERSSATDATMIWRPVSAGHADIADSALSHGGFRHLDIADSALSDVAESAISSLETDVTTPLPPEGEQDGLFGSAPAVPAGPPAAEDSDPLRGFDAWYDLYPRKIAKGDARKAWQQVLRGGADPEVIRLGLQVQLESLREQQARGFCPYPASWLRAERWTDSEDTNVRHLRPAIPAPGETYDPAHASTLPPPPPKDLFA